MSHLKNLRSYIDSILALEEKLDTFLYKNIIESFEKYTQMHKEGKVLNQQLDILVSKMEEKVKIIGIAPGVAYEFVNIKYFKCILDDITEKITLFMDKYREEELFTSFNFGDEEEEEKEEEPYKNILYEDDIILI